MTKIQFKKRQSMGWDEPGVDPAGPFQVQVCGPPSSSPRLVTLITCQRALQVRLIESNRSSHPPRERDSRGQGVKRVNDSRLLMVGNWSGGDLWAWTSTER